jgi:hypothetical protein
LLMAYANSVMSALSATALTVNRAVSAVADAH